MALNHKIRKSHAAVERELADLKWKFTKIDIELKREIAFRSASKPADFISVCIGEGEQRGLQKAVDLIEREIGD